jgi:hypothetical protein
MSVLFDLTTALVDDLNDTFSASFTATRNDRPRHSVTDLATLKVVVSARLLQYQPHTRGHRARTATLEIVFQKHLAERQPGATEQDEIDDLNDITEDVAEHYTLGCRLTGATTFRLESIALASNQPFNTKDLDDLAVFNSSLVLVFTDA